MNKEPDPNEDEALICIVIFIIILSLMFFYMIFFERNTVRDDVNISREITPACADMTERTGRRSK